MITADAAQTWLAELAEQHSLQQSSADAKRKSEAVYRIGVVLETIRESLNQDLLSHDEVSGLSSKYLIAALESRGFRLDYSQQRRQFLSRAQYFREALQWSPSAPFAADAGYRPLDGLYQDKIGHDPLGAVTAPALNTEMIALAQKLSVAYPAHPWREEIEFIAAILYTRAAAAGTRSLPQPVSWIKQGVRLRTSSGVMLPACVPLRCQCCAMRWRVAESARSAVGLFFQDRFELCFALALFRNLAQHGFAGRLVHFRVDHGRFPLSEIIDAPGTEAFEFSAELVSNHRTGSAEKFIQSVAIRGFEHKEIAARIAPDQLSLLVGPGRRGAKHADCRDKYSQRLHRPSSGCDRETLRRDAVAADGRIIPPGQSDRQTV